MVIVRTVTLLECRSAVSTILPVVDNLLKLMTSSLTVTCRTEAEKSASTAGTMKGNRKMDKT